MTSPLRSLLGLAALAGVAGAAPASAPEGVTLRAMSFNIRLDLASDGANSWPHRRDMVADLIRDDRPDILGLQEVLLGQKRDLERALPQFAMVGAGRDDGRDRGEFSPIAYRTDRFVLVGSGTIWLSETPTVPGKGWDAAFPRVATWAILRDRKTGTFLRVLNTHFDHVGTIARRQSAAMLSSWLAMGDWASLPTIVMGDLNSEPDGDAYQLLAQGPARLRDARLTSAEPLEGPQGSFHGFGAKGQDLRLIDHLFVSGHFRVRRHAIVARTSEGRLPSDHYPVSVALEWAKP